MAVTKQTYSAAATWTLAQFADLFRSAFIDAGLMTEWHDSFVAGSNTVRVLRIQHDAVKTYGSSFYYFFFRDSDNAGVSIASGWNTATDVPTGTQFLDYHRLPADTASVSSNSRATRLTAFFQNPASTIFLDRFTSADDAKQSWFVIRQGTNIGDPFTILHKDTSLHPWLDLDKGIINGFATIEANVSNSVGFIRFCLQENIRRCLLTGTALRGDTEVISASNRFHGIGYTTHAYTGFGSQNNSTASNYTKTNLGGAVILPVGKASANPAFLTDYVPICTNLPWSPFTPTRLADDFAVYMHYSDNATAYGDRFIVQAGINEWETLKFANNAVVIDGASPTFLARVV